MFLFHRAAWHTLHTSDPVLVLALVNVVFEDDEELVEELDVDVPAEP